MAEPRRAGRLDQPREPRRISLPRFDPEAFGRWSEGSARYMGTPKFIVYMTVVIAAWFGWNSLAPAQWRFDPYTFTFLTLILSLQASYAAPLILLAQNRQTDRDRLALEEDRRRATLQKADTEYLSREIAALRIALGDVTTRDFLRSELTRLTDELTGAVAEDRYDAAHRQQKLDRKQQKDKQQKDKQQKDQRRATGKAEAVAGFDRPLDRYADVDADKNGKDKDGDMGKDLDEGKGVGKDVDEDKDLDKDLDEGVDDARRC